MAEAVSSLLCRDWAGALGTKLQSLQRSTAEGSSLAEQWCPRSCVSSRLPGLPGLPPSPSPFTDDRSRVRFSLLAQGPLSGLLQVWHIPVSLPQQQLLLLLLPVPLLPTAWALPL